MAFSMGPMPAAERHGDTVRDHYSNSTTSAGRANSIISDASYVTEETEPDSASVVLAPLQEKGPSQGTHEFDPLEDEQAGSFDLVAPPSETYSRGPSVPSRSGQLFSREHLQALFAVPSLFQRFAGFLASERKSSISVLIYYLDAVKSLKAIAYANSLTASLDPVGALDFTQANPEPLINKTLQEKADKAFDVLVQNDLPAYIAHIYINIVSPSISQRIAGTMAPHLQQASEGLAEVFCLTDPSREDNPIVFASEEFTRTTQYGLAYVVGRNCRFLQGPDTDQKAVRRLADALNIKAPREHSEVILNYRRDGSPFLNLLMMAPLTDSRGCLRYFIGAQIDVTGLVQAGTDLDALNKMLNTEPDWQRPHTKSPSDDFESLCELFNHTELKTVSQLGGRIYREDPSAATNEAFDGEDDQTTPQVPSIPQVPELAGGVSNKPRLLLREVSSSEDESGPSASRLPASPTTNGRLSGVFQQYLLVRPYPSLRILFTSPSLRVPGIIQSPLMSRIGGSQRVKDNLNAALAEGRGVTAKVKWVTRFDADGTGRSRYLHFTPLIGANGHIGVWMVVMVDAESHERKGNGMGRNEDRARNQAPAVMDNIGDRIGAPSIRSVKKTERVGDRYHRLRREEANGGALSRVSSLEGSALSVKL